MKPHTLRTWIEIDPKALRHNVGEFFRLIAPETRLMAVIKSNAYGHGLVLTAKLLAESRIMDQESKKKPHNSEFLTHDCGLWFGVDSIVEALRLRREGIVHPILVLGFTLPARFAEAAREHISVSISNFDALESWAAAGERPAIHVKLDTGMHRQGFLKKDISRLMSVLKKKKAAPEGIFTHFASAKDAGYPTYTLVQLAEFGEAVARMEQAGFSSMIRHAAATGGTILFPDAHLDMVRVGMGLYGYWPSQEAKLAHAMRQTRDRKPLLLKPVLSWKTIVGEVKKIPKGSFVGYDLTERTHRETIIAVLPIGYWHGYDRGLSSVGNVLVRNARARVTGRVSMDMIVIDVTDIPGVRVGDEAVIMGNQGKEIISAENLGGSIGTSAYEMLTRINPLIKRIVI